jgi:hypothetical protein
MCDDGRPTEALGRLQEVYMSVRPFLAIVLVLVAVMTLTSTVVLAAPGGNGSGKGGGHGKGGGRSSTASLVVEGDPFAAWGEEVYVVHGTGFHPDEPVYLSLATPGCCAGDITMADGDGNFTMPRTTGAPGTYEIRASQFSDKGKLTFMASVSFLVTDS